MNIYQKLNAARAKFHTQKLKKSGHNKFANYYYFELGDFVIPALEIFKEFGLTSLISFGTEVAEMRIVNNDDTTESIYITSPMSSAALKGCHEVQNLGAVQTYIRRYLWVVALEVIEHDALDATTGNTQTDTSSVMTDHIIAIQDATDEQSLKAAYQAAYKACPDANWQKKIIAVKDEKKASLK